MTEKGIAVAEYLGQNVSREETIKPTHDGMCPFAQIKCAKINKKKNKKPPVCCTRKSNGMIWIVCSERLCSTHGNGITDYQRYILRSIAREIFDAKATLDDIIYKKEVRLDLPNNKVMNADYILGIKDKRYGRGRGPTRVILEFQGGGSTSNTGTITRYMREWESNSHRTNKTLRKIHQGVGSIENDSWKRQQDQLITKSHIASISGFGFVLCVGETLFDYICDRLQLDQNVDNLREQNANWDFVILAMQEIQVEGRIGFAVHPNKVVYTRFQDFSSVMTGRGGAQADKFTGKFLTLGGQTVNIHD